MPPNPKPRSQIVSPFWLTILSPETECQFSSVEDFIFVQANNKNATGIIERRK